MARAGEGMTCERGAALHRAHQRGVEAGLFAPQVADLDELCPYADIRTGNGTVTFSKAFRIAWLRGFCEGRETRERQQQEVL